MKTVNVKLSKMHIYNERTNLFRFINDSLFRLILGSWRISNPHDQLVMCQGLKCFHKFEHYRLLFFPICKTHQFQRFIFLIYGEFQKKDARESKKIKISKSTITKKKENKMHLWDSKSQPSV